MAKIRLLIADDHAVLRAGLHLLLNAQPDMEVVGEAGDGAEALEKADVLRPDVLLLDLSMPGMGGLEAIHHLKRRCPEVKILILSMYDDESYLREALRAGAAGYTLKKGADTELLAAIRAVQRGEIFLHPALTKVLVGDLLRKELGREKRATTPAGYTALSEREREVLRFLAHGYTNQQVADRLFLSLKTVETYKARLMRKLGLRSRADLVRYAMQQGLLRPDP
ncbi:MAG: response regulator transcription factor [Chloroflexi bacterium]|nr:response regulator transcription factor [Chloroflexota bacterium]